MTFVRSGVHPSVSSRFGGGNGFEVDSRFSFGFNGLFVHSCG